MGKNFKVILVKSSQCFHCKNFEPIYSVSKDIKLDDYSDVDFEEYDFAENGIKTDMENFKNKYNELFSKIEGYPTVFVFVEDGDKVHSAMVDHTVVSEEISDSEQQIKDAAQRFLKNVSNGFKTLESDGKSLYLESQSGGSNKCCTTDFNNQKSNIDYKNKYLKYKNKYLELKKKF